MQVEADTRKSCLVAEKSTPKRTTRSLREEKSRNGLARAEENFRLVSFSLPVANPKPARANWRIASEISVLSLAERI